MLESGTILHSRYQIVRQVGRGGLGAVFEAIDNELNARVAIKEMLRVSPEAQDAFAHEASLLANLDHPMLPGVTDRFTEGVNHYLVQKFITGNDLSVLLERSGPIKLYDALRIADQVLEVLEYLHSFRPPIIHRDIKPSNIKINHQGKIFLLDFGMAKGAAGLMSTLTSEVSVAGATPGYASPEQLRGTGTDERSDLFSLSATLYHLMTATLPSRAIIRLEALANQHLDPLVPADSVNLEIPSQIAMVITKGLSLKPEMRHASASEMRRFLHAANPSEAVTQTMSSKGMAIHKTKEGAPENLQLPVISDSLAALKRYYVTSGGYAHADVDEAGRRFFALFTDEVERQLQIITDDNFIKARSEMDSPHRNVILLDENGRRFRIAPGPRVYEFSLTTPAPANAMVARTFGIEVPKDCGVDDSLVVTIFPPGNTFGASIAELFPVPSDNLLARIRADVEKLISDALGELNRMAGEAKRKSGY
jgi:serine/threonine protein kinase